MNISNQLLGAGLLVARLFGALGGAGEGSLVVEAIEVAAGLLELLNPFLGLETRYQLLCLSHISASGAVYLGNHHMTIKCASSARLLGLIDMASDLGDNGGAKGDVGNKVTVPCTGVSTTMSTR